MPTSLVEGNSLLAIDIGAVNTRAAYFDVVEGGYRFIALGQSPTTTGAAVRNIMIGVQLAIENLQTLLGKDLMDEDGRLLIPSRPEGTGVDSMLTTLSVGPAIKTLLVGLLPEISFKSIENLALTTYTRVVDTINLSDRRLPDEQVDAIVRYSPELVLIAGGVDGGATHATQKALEIIGLAAYLLPETKRPAVLYAGNQALAQEVRNSLNNIASAVRICPNLRPAQEIEDLAPAQSELASLVVKLRQKQMSELEEAYTLSGGIMLPSSYAQGRMVRFLSSYFGSGKGVLSLDVGASAISLGASFSGDLHLKVYPQLGLGEALGGLNKYTSPEEIARWLALDLKTEVVRDYLAQKALYPAYIPAAVEELAIEQAIVRQNLQLAIRWMLPRLPARWRPRNGLLPAFEPILASGAAITNAPTLGQKLLMLLDGLQPTGITTFAIDQNNLLAMLGAAVEVNHILPVQVLDSGALSYLATVITPVTKAKYGTSILQVKLIQENGAETTSEIKMGSLKVLPLESGQTARLQLRPLQRADVGLGSGRAGEVDVIGSAMGVVIDARGRPLQLPPEPAKRRELAQKWLSTLGG